MDLSSVRMRRAKLCVWQSRAFCWVLLPIPTVISVCSQTLERWQNWPCHSQSSLLLQAQEHSLLSNSWQLPVDGEGLKFSLISPKGWGVKLQNFLPDSLRGGFSANYTEENTLPTWRRSPTNHYGDILGERQQQWCTGETTGRGSRERQEGAPPGQLLSSSTEQCFLLFVPFSHQISSSRKRAFFPKQEIEKSCLISFPFCPYVMLILEAWGQHVWIQIGQGEWF